MRKTEQSERAAHSLREAGSAAFLVVFGAWLLLGGCGNNSSSLTAHDFAASMPAAVCESVATCPEETRGAGLGDIAIALADLCGKVEGPDIDLEDILDRGHTAFDAQEAERCIEATRTCRSASSACERSLTGTLPGGAGCVSDLECASGQCGGNSRDSCGACTTAARPAGLGEHCLAAVDCERIEGQDVACVRNAAAASKVCVVLREISAGASCAEPSDVCRQGTYCGAAKKCQAPKAAGELCTESDRCIPGASCTKVDGERRCISVVIRRAGESCTDFSALQPSSRGMVDLCDLSEELRCDPHTQKCARVASVGVGESCGGDAACGEGLFCDEGTLCAAPRANGAACRARGECVSMHCIDSVCGESDLPVCSQR